MVDFLYIYEQVDPVQERTGYLFPVLIYSLRGTLARLFRTIITAGAGIRGGYK